MGEAQGWQFNPTFNRSVKVTAGDERLTSDAGVLLIREADQRLGLTEWLADQLMDPRDPRRIRYELSELLRERLYALTLGYSNQDDLDRLAHDPAMRMAVWDRPGEAVLNERLASQPTQSRLIDILTRFGGNLQALRNGLGESLLRHVRSTNRDARVPFDDTLRRFLDLRRGQRAEHRGGHRHGRPGRFGYSGHHRRS